MKKLNFVLLLATVALILGCNRNSMKGSGKNISDSLKELNEI